MRHGIYFCILAGDPLAYKYEWQVKEVTNRGQYTVVTGHKFQFTDHTTEAEAKEACGRHESEEDDHLDDIEV